MKVLILASAFTALSAPLAFASGTELPREAEDRRAPQVRIDSGSPGGSAPQTAQTNRSTARAQAEAQAAERDAADEARTFAERRRSGKRIPDAELIGPRGAL